MSRPPVYRRVLQTSTVQYLEPHPRLDDTFVTLFRDEYEAIRLSDVLGFYQERAAEQMQVSRSTFSRILERARRKMGIALIMGRRLVITEAPPIETYAISPIACGCKRRRRMAQTRGGCLVHPLSSVAINTPNPGNTDLDRRDHNKEYES